jgi:hypothetical protein
MLDGALWCGGGILVTGLTYSMASSGGTYIIAWGAIVIGAIQFLRGLTTDDSEDPSRPTAKQLLIIAAHLESVDRARAIHVYQEIIKKFPNTPESDEAQRNIQTLKAHESILAPKS